MDNRCGVKIFQTLLTTRFIISPIKEAEAGADFISMAFFESPRIAPEMA
ncbi:hypothetical protein MgSA37_02202 [Mucilaginibacter gotjawali]|uniref:Uncharacterized protein n=2 Tax=Mucilaginibacter gotjawali TaxID=1550579 RepID=A0A0X8X1Q5_9SPHI|nr:hypothetical protein [Mucilaginibacter gotjawali]BAU54031.1 hypothetical protein MgSA37_02202 [Mucilaginibacter gotjawali]